MNIQDPMERMESQMERQFDLVKEDGTYPCCRCGKYYNADEMHPVSADPSAPLECGRCDEEENSHRIKKQIDRETGSEARILNMAKRVTKQAEVEEESHIDRLVRLRGIKKD